MFQTTNQIRYYPARQVFCESIHIGAQPWGALKKHMFEITVERMIWVLFLPMFFSPQFPSHWYWKPTQWARWSSSPSLLVIIEVSIAVGPVGPQSSSIEILGLSIRNHQKSSFLPCQIFDWDIDLNRFFQFVFFDHHKPSIDIWDVPIHKSHPFGGTPMAIGNLHLLRRRS